MCVCIYAFMYIYVYMYVCIWLPLDCFSVAFHLTKVVATPRLHMLSVAAGFPHGAWMHIVHIQYTCAPLRAGGGDLLCQRELTEGVIVLSGRVVI